MCRFAIHRTRQDSWLTGLNFWAESCGYGGCTGGVAGDSARRVAVEGKSLSHGGHRGTRGKPFGLCR
ncbi:hypothetical protein SBA7_160010 [Candidatus Sulfotelmatobacter sp. SbA7]|nr:hypothetical protein SBA7_160010 [Candidatus Sulfotelmatobacter sp. SbA7]